MGVQNVDRYTLVRLVLRDLQEMHHIEGGGRSVSYRYTQSAWLPGIWTVTKGLMRCVLNHTLYWVRVAAGDTVVTKGFMYILLCRYGFWPAWTSRAENVYCVFNGVVGAVVEIAAHNKMRVFRACYSGCTV